MLHSPIADASRCVVAWLSLLIISPAMVLASGELQPLSHELMALVEQAQLSVVEVTAVKPVAVAAWRLDRFSQQGVESVESETYAYRQRQVGSGWLYDDQGHIVTTAGIVENAAQLGVRFADGAAFVATLVGKDRPTNIAVIKVDATMAPSVGLADSVNVRSGAWIAAIGRTYGQVSPLSWGLTSDIEEIPGHPLCPFIKFTAPIRPGNTGGLLIDAEGRNLGMIVAALASHQAPSPRPLGSEAPERLVASDQQDASASRRHDIGFALPIHFIQPIARKLIQDGRIERGWLGVVTPVLEIDPFGVTIRQIQPGSPAKEAHLRPGDRVVAVNGVAMDRGSEFQRLVLKSEPGRLLDLEIQRGKRLMTIAVKLGSLTD